MITSYLTLMSSHFTHLTSLSHKPQRTQTRSAPYRGRGLSWPPYAHDTTAGDRARAAGTDAGRWSAPIHPPPSRFRSVQRACYYRGHRGQRQGGLGVGWRGARRLGSAAAGRGGGGVEGDGRVGRRRDVAVISRGASAWGEGECCSFDRIVWGTSMAMRLVVCGGGARGRRKRRDSAAVGGRGLGGRKAAGGSRPAGSLVARRFRRPPRPRGAALAAAAGGSVGRGVAGQLGRAARAGGGHESVPIPAFAHSRARRAASSVRERAAQRNTRAGTARGGARAPNCRSFVYR